MGGGAAGIGETLGCQDGDRGLGGEEVGKGGEEMRSCQPPEMCCRTIKATNPTHFFVES